jgi:glycosyltransferase involved in cell wall biosynthesis
VLYIVNAFPYPLTSGYLRHYHLIRELWRRGHHVSLLAITSTEPTAADRAALEPFTERIVTVGSDRRDRSIQRRTIRRLRVVSGGEPAALRLRDAAAALLDAIEQDVALFSGIRTYPAIQALADLPLVADVCDAASSRVLGNLRHGPVLRTPLLIGEFIEARLIERALLDRADHTLFASVRDLEPVVGTGDIDKATVVPNGVDLAYWRRPPGVGLGRQEIVMSGAMDYPPNSDAALHLIHKILPRVRWELPTAHLTIVGRDPTPGLVKAGQVAGVTVTGAVADIRPFLAAASVFAAPLRFGAGIQNKLLEALAMQVPIVASRNAADGLITVDGASPPLTVADDQEVFANALVRQLRAAEMDPTPPVAGRAYVGRHFSWSRSGDLLDLILREVVASRVTRPAGQPPRPSRAVSSHGS